ncbi:MAG: GtrA family protein [Bacteroidales bacterium]|nr:GtrA family protein [Bacteroidales bacterium]
MAYNLLGCSYWMSSAANYVFGSILSYFLNKYFTFRSSGKSWAEIGRFVVSILFCYLMAYGVAKWATNELLSSCNVSLRENISMAVGMVLFVVLNYVLQRLFVFKNKKQ